MMQRIRQVTFMELKKHSRGVNKNNMHSIPIVNDTGKSLKSSLRTARARADTT